MWKEKNHKDKGKLIKFYAKIEGQQHFLHWKKDDLWLFQGSATDEKEQEWWLLLNTFTGYSTRFQKKKHQGWKQALKSDGYVVEVIT